MSQRIAMVLTAAIIFCAAAPRAAEFPTLETKPVGAALFKNGYGFIESQAAIPAGAQTVWLKNPPAATLGTLWFGSQGKSRVASLRIFKHKGEKPVDPSNFEALIRANKGKTAKIWLDKDTMIEGEIWTPEPVKPEESAGAGDMRPVSSPYISAYVPPTPPATIEPPSYCVLRNASGATALRLGMIHRIEIAGQSLSETIPTEEPLIECKLDKPAEEGDLLLVHYLASGLSWMPAYEIDLKDGKTAGLRWQATLMNDAIDLKDIKIRCIVGFPNFQFNYLKDPLTAGQPVQEFLQQLFNGAPNAGNAFSNGRFVAQQNISNNAYFNYDQQSGGMPAAPDSGDWREDLFYLPSIEASLARGERATVSLGEEEAKYRHLYTWNIADTIPINNGNYSNNDSSTPDAEPPAVWHEIEIVNPGKRPWTTGSAIVMQKGAPLSQDTLRYTAMGGKSTVKITRATDVTADAKEFEKDRTPNAKHAYGSDFDLVNVRGELKVCNRRGEAVELRVTKRTTGSINSSAPEAKVEIRAEGLRPLNQISTLEWTLQLKPGEEQTLSYETQVFVRQ